MPQTELRVVYAPRIYPIVQPGAVLSDPQRPLIAPVEVTEITGLGVRTACGLFLTALAVDSMRLDRNGPPPKRAA